MNGPVQQSFATDATIIGASYTRRQCSLAYIVAAGINPPLATVRVRNVHFAMVSVIVHTPWLNSGTALDNQDVCPATDAVDHNALHKVYSR